MVGTTRIAFAAALAAALALTACAAEAPSRSSAEPRPEEGPRQVTVLYVADLHGQLEAHPELFWRDGEERLETAGGLARVATAVERIRAERGGDVLVLDAGDTIQGSGAAALTEGAAVIPPLNALGLDVGLPGNWEVAYGADVLRERAAEMEHPLVAANVRDAATGERLFAPYVVREVAGVRVAIIGYTDPDVPTRQPPDYSAGLTYDGPEALPHLVREVRREHRADVVLLLSHVGLAKAVDLTGRLPGLDAHLSGDTHERTYEPVDVGGTWVVEPGAFGSFLGRLDLWVEDGRVVDRRWELIELTADRFPEDPEVAALVEEQLAPLRPRLDRVVGHTHGTLMRYNVIETTLDQVLADALREATGTDVALSNGFRFAHPVGPGPITEADLWDFYPVVTRLKVGTVTGAQIRAFWERELENVFARDPAERFGGWIPRPSGMTVRFEADAPSGERVREVRVHGEPLRDDAEYTLTACLREGDPADRLCRIDGVKDARVLEIDAHEAVRRYLARHPNVHRALEGRVVADDRPQVLRTQR